MQSLTLKNLMIIKDSIIGAFILNLAITTECLLVFFFCNCYHYATFILKFLTPQLVSMFLSMNSVLELSHCEIHISKDSHALFYPRALFSLTVQKSQ